MKRVFAAVLMMIILLSASCVRESGRDKAADTSDTSETAHFSEQATGNPTYTPEPTSEPTPEPTPTPTPTPEPTPTSTPTTTPTPAQTSAAKKPYLIRINRVMNCVTVYKADENGGYTLPYKAFICSTGTSTPLGQFSTTDKYVWRALFGDVFGQYATRITGSILFHSVPYFTQNKDDLEWEEYNKLGTKASLGCIRLTCADAKWIYDNCPKGTTVEIYDDVENPGPLGKPDFIRIDGNSPYRGWDPTDPDENNPWKRD